MRRRAGVTTLFAVLGALLLLELPAAASADPPTCSDASYVTKPNVPVPLSTSLCSDREGDALTPSLDTFPGNGEVSPTADGYEYVPDPGFHGNDQFTYHATDIAHGESSNVATIHILVDTAPNCSDATATVSMGNSVVLPDLPCDDADGDDVDIAVGDPGRGRIDISPDGSTVTYVPAPGYVGPDSFEYLATDPFHQDSETGTMRITVTPPPAPPAPVAPVVVATPPRDTTPPSFTMAIAGKRLARVLAKGLRLRVTTTEAGTATVTVTVDKATARKLGLNRRARGPVVVGRATGPISARNPSLVVKLTGKARHALKRARRVTLHLKTVITDAAGNQATRTMSVGLKR
jgi:hypothetical protein